MPARSRDQQRAASGALSAKRGEIDPKDLESASRDMYDSMTDGELEELASTKLDGLPEHKPH